MEDGMSLVIKYLVELQKEILAKAKGYKNQRHGQSYMTALYNTNRKVYNRIAAGEGDCFYSDANISAFWMRLTQIVLDYQLTSNN